MLSQVILVALVCCVNQVDGGSLQGRQLTVTTIHAPPLVIVNNDTVARYKGRYEGILIDVLQQLSTLANFTYNIQVVQDGSYGWERTPGQWTGMIGEIKNNVADIAVAPLTISSARAKHITYTQPIMDAGLRVLYRKSQPPVSNQSLLILLSPFTTGLWFMIFACFLVASFAFFAIGKLSPYEREENSPKGNDSITATLGHCFLYTVSSFMHQDKTSTPRSPAGRVMTIFWWIFTTLVITTFAANFAAFLMSKGPDVRRLPFLNFDELSRQSDVQVGCLDSGATKAYFSKSKMPMQQRLWKLMNSKPGSFLSSYDEGLKRVRTDNFALISEGPLAKYHMNRSPCDLLVVGAPIDSRSYGFVCNKDSDVCDLLNPFILTLTRSHFVTSATRKWTNTGECTSFLRRMVLMRGKPVVDAFKRLGIRLETQMSFDRFSAAFYILLGGILLALVVLGGEILYVNKFGK